MSNIHVSYSNLVDIVLVLSMSNISGSLIENKICDEYTITQFEQEVH